MFSILRIHGLLTGTCLLLAATGCSGQKHAAPVNPELARKSLCKALDSWQRGEDLTALRHGSAAITVQDMDWKAGYKLVDYQIVGEGKYDDANLLCPVKLNLQDPQGNRVNREVTYMVGTDPVITVFREMKF